MASATNQTLDRPSRQYALRWLAAVVVAAGVTLAQPVNAQTQAADPWSELGRPGRVVLMRHALAPGTGDPPGFAIGECATQRNLDATGRQQARDAGAALRTHAGGVEAVFTSRWCRCRETAALLDVGTPVAFDALNSFYEDRASAAERTRALRAALDQLPRDGGLRIYVTHQVNITALIGEPVASGEMKVLRLLPGGGFELVASLTP